MPQVLELEIVIAVTNGLPDGADTDTTVATGEAVIFVLDTIAPGCISPIIVEVNKFITVPVKTELDLPVETFYLYKFIHS